MALLDALGPGAGAGGPSAIACSDALEGPMAKARRWHVRAYQGMSRASSRAQITKSDSRGCPVLARTGVLFPLSALCRAIPAALSRPGVGHTAGPWRGLGPGPASASQANRREMLPHRGWMTTRSLRPRAVGHPLDRAPPPRRPHGERCPDRRLVDRSLRPPRPPSARAASSGARPCRRASGCGAQPPHDERPRASPAHQSRPVFGDPHAVSRSSPLTRECWRRSGW